MTLSTRELQVVKLTYQSGGFLHDMPHELVDRLYEYTNAYEEMPYGTQKARTGSPEEWLYDKLSEMYPEWNYE